VSLGAASEDEQVAHLLEEASDTPFRHHRGEHYTVHSDDPDRDLEALARNLETVRRDLAEVLDVDPKERGRHYQVIHLQGPEAYRQLCEALRLEKHAVEATGCFAPRLPGRPVIVQGRGEWGTYRHELAHQFIHGELGGGLGDVPWVGEGMGALFEACPPQDFTGNHRYGKGRKEILDRRFSLEAFSMRRDREEEVYDIGATIHRAFLFGPHRESYLGWVKDLARRKCTPSDLPRYTKVAWRDLQAHLRAFCRAHEPSTPYR
jgi:hypothetical protein